MAEENPEQQKPWFDGLDAEFVGTLANRGLDKKPAHEAALNLWQAHREASQMITKLTGTPDKDRILIQPKPDATEDELKAFYVKLGRPEKEDGYEFKVEGDEDKAFAEFMRKASLKRGLTKAQAEGIFGDLSEFGEKIASGSEAQRTEAIAKEDKALRDNWGANFTANKIVAQRGARDLGIAEADFEAMVTKPGFATQWEQFRKHGQAIGEDKFLGGNNQPNGVYTYEQAVSQKAALQRDPEWSRRYLNGGAEEKRTMQALCKIIDAGNQAQRAA